MASWRQVQTTSRQVHLVWSKLVSRSRECFKMTTNKANLERIKISNNSKAVGEIRATGPASRRLSMVQPSIDHCWSEQYTYHVTFNREIDECSKWVNINNNSNSSRSHTRYRLKTMTPTSGLFSTTTHTCKVTAMSMALLQPYKAESRRARTA